MSRPGESGETAPLPDVCRLLATVFPSLSMTDDESRRQGILRNEGRNSASCRNKISPTIGENEIAALRYLGLGPIDGH